MAQNDKFFYFLGVSTQNSAIISLFPAWCEVLGVCCSLRGVDLAIDSSPSSYTSLLEEMKKKSCVGGLITTHKSNVFRYGETCFKQVSPVSEALHEVSVIYKRKNHSELFGDALDTVSIEPIINKLTETNSLWSKGDKNVVVFGGGGAGLALVYALCNKAISQPINITIIENNQKRIVFLKKMLNNSILFPLNVEVLHSEQGEFSISHVGKKPLIVNATGMGKDLPGSPIKNFQNIPPESTIWDFNYRGELSFLKYASKYNIEKKLLIEDGWDYFLSGWVHVMCMVFNIEISDNIKMEFREIANIKREI